MNTFYLKIHSKPIDSYTGFFNQTPFYFYLSTNDLTIKNYSINLYSQDSNSAPYQIPQNKWSHLLPQWAFYNNKGEYIEKCNTWAASSISSNNSILPISSYYNLSSTGNFSGLIYLASAYYIDSLPTTATIIATLETSSFSVTSDNFEANLPSYSNSLIFAKDTYKILAPPICSIKITQDGKNDINKIKWSTIPIPYVITVHANTANNTYNSNKYGLTAINPIMFWFPTAFNTISSNQVTRFLYDVQDVTWENSVSSFYLSAKDDYGFKIGGYYKGYFTTSSTFLSAYMKAVIGSLTGTSTYFNIKPFEIPYEIRRFNESWDLTNMMRSHALAEITYNNDNFFKFINESVGGLESDYQSIGRKFYEKIANFVKNQSDIETCNFDQFYSLTKSLDVPTDDYGLVYPSEVKKLMDITSINHEKLWGGTCHCNRNFFVGEKCNRCNHTHSLNRTTTKISPNQYIVSAGVPFVVENIHTKLDYNRYDILYPSISTTLGNSTYPMSGISNISWLTSSIYFKYYIYDYIPNICDYRQGGVINWNDSYNTLLSSVSSLNDWYGTDGIVEEMFNYELHRGLYSGN